MSAHTCPHIGRRRGRRREEPIDAPAGKNCCYARLPAEEAAMSTLNWLSRLGLADRPTDIPCLPIGQAHQRTYCLTADHLKCKLYHPPVTNQSQDPSSR